MIILMNFYWNKENTTKAMNNFVLYKKRKNLNIYELYYKIKKIFSMK